MLRGIAGRPARSDPIVSAAATQGAAIDDILCYVVAIFLHARKDPVQTHQINISHGRDNVHEIRRELFAFSEILDVFVTGTSDSLVVVCTGRPRLGEWLRALRAAGYQVPARRHPAAISTTPHSIMQIDAEATQIDPARQPHAA